MNRLSPLAVYCGASCGAKPSYAAAARSLGAAMARRGIGLVYGGGKVGLMGEVADGLLAADPGAAVIGIITTELVKRELAHDGIPVQDRAGQRTGQGGQMLALRDAGREEEAEAMVLQDHGLR